MCLFVVTCNKVEIVVKLAKKKNKVKKENGGKKNCHAVEKLLHTGCDNKAC